MTALARALFSAPPVSPAAPSTETVNRAARTALRRLREPGAFLLVARGVDQAGIFVDRDGLRRTATLSPALVLAFWQRGWIAAKRRTPRLGRYAIAPEGRAALREFLRTDNAARLARRAAAAE